MRACSSRAARSSSRRRATPATASRSRRRSRATAASSSWPTSSRPRSRRSCARTAPRSSCARPTSRPSRPRATTRSPPGWRATSRARSSPTSTGTWRTPTPTSGRPVPRSGRQTEGRITHLVASASAPAARSPASAATSRRRTPRIRVIGADPEGSVLSGDTARPYLTEGVGEDFFPGTYDPAMVDRWVRVSRPRRVRDGAPDHARGGDPGRRVVRHRAGRRARRGGRDLMRDEPRRPRCGRGRDPARRRPQLPLEALQRRVDAGQRPAGRRPGAVARVGELLDDRHHGQPTARPWSWRGRRTGSASAIDLLQRYGISQLPVTERADDDDLEGIVGSVSEKSLLDRAYRDPDVVERTVGEVMDRPLPTLDVGATAGRRVRPALGRRRGAAS